MQEMDAYCVPHHMKAKSAGKLVYALPLVLFSDDTSGNKSKKWPTFISWYLKLAGLSRQTSLKNMQHTLYLLFRQFMYTRVGKAYAEELLLLETRGIE